MRSIACCLRAQLACPDEGVRAYVIILVGCCEVGPFVSLSERSEPCPLQFISIKKIVGIERNQPPIGMHNVDAGFLHTSHVERVGVNELHDDHAENVLVRDAVRDKDFGQTAQQLAQTSGATERRMICSKESEKVIADNILLLVQYCVG